MTTLKKNKKKKKYIASKLHNKQFGHPKSTSLTDLIKATGISDKDLLDMVKNLDKSCELCMRYIMGFSLALDFSETVAMDLKQFKGVCILYLVDYATVYSASAIPLPKQKEVIIGKIFKHWIGIFETSNLFLSDIGGEFNKSCLERCASN